MFFFSLFLRFFYFFQALGKTGKITKIYSDGDLRVTVDGQTWTFNPLCVTSVPGTATEMNNTMTANQREEHTRTLILEVLHCLIFHTFVISANYNFSLFFRSFIRSLTSRTPPARCR